MSTWAGPFPVVWSWVLLVQCTPQGNGSPHQAFNIRWASFVLYIYIQVQCKTIEPKYKTLIKNNNINVLRNASVSFLCSTLHTTTMLFCLDLSRALWAASTPFYNLCLLGPGWVYVHLSVPLGADNEIITLITLLLHNAKSIPNLIWKEQKLVQGVTPRKQLRRTETLKFCES